MTCLLLVGGKPESSPTHLLVPNFRAENLMRISVISPSFNQAKFIGRTISSVAKQNYAAKQHIIVDGGSTDGSVQLIEDAKSSHTHIETIIEPDRGQSDAINKGFRRADGEILAWLNTDDFYYDSAVLQKIADAFRANPGIDIIYGRGQRLDTDGKVIREAWINRKIFTEWDFWKSLGILQPSLFFRRTVFDRIGGLEEHYNLQMDYDYWIRMAKAGFKFKFINELLSCAVVHEDAKSTRDRQRQLSECISMLYHHFGELPAEWYDRLADFHVTQVDQKIDATRGRRDELIQLKTRPLARFTKEALPYSAAPLYFPQRLIITAFDSEYFYQGINLIASLHRTSFLSFDKIIVFSLDLSRTEIGHLNSLEKVTVKQLPPAPPSFPDFTDPKGRAYKSACIAAEGLDISDGALVLWLDAGLSICSDIDEIFHLVNNEDFFITNHDDSRHWPFYNVQFTHDEAVKVLNASTEELIAPHMCSAIVGYKRGGQYQDLIYEARRLGRIRSAVMWPKVASKEERKRFPKLNNEEMEEVRKEATETKISPTELKKKSPYYGHRTQSIFSILCSRYKAPTFSSSLYRQGNDISSAASHRNWLSSAKETDELSHRSSLEGLTKSSRAFHHRGTYTDLTGLLFRRFIEPAFVVGNGPSLRGFDFEALRGRIWVGMNAAYRFWDDIGIYPYIYSCLDTVVLESHKDEVWRLIQNKGKFGIEFFFLRKCFLESYPDAVAVPGIFFLEDLQKHVDWLDRGKVTTGSFSLYFCAFLGFYNIGLLGVDLNYVEKIDEAEPEGRELVISREVGSNPNYFFDGYQKPGDRYNPPNRHADMHLRSWNEAAEVLAKWPISVVNCNLNSAVRCFPFEDAKSLMDIWDQEMQQAMNAAQTFDQLVERQIVYRNVLLEAISEGAEGFFPTEEQARRTAVWYRDVRRGGSVHRSLAPAVEPLHPQVRVRDASSAQTEFLRLTGRVLTIGAWGAETEEYLKQAHELLPGVDDPVSAADHLKKIEAFVRRQRDHGLRGMGNV
ncbi:hypothetical protein C2I36_14515 [Rhodobacteraceae bacterium WD3A24]|nr:hypothetical protein C2I36_14515 [Rhodobacteraceae bacterium WD3A24]